MRVVTHVLALVACVCGSAAGMGCEELIYRDIDPQIRLTGADAGEPDGPPELDVGFLPAGSWVSLADDASLIVINGLQGGTWTMPTIRTRGVATFANVVCDVVIDDTGEHVGHIDAKTKFFPSQDGPLEVHALPIRIRHAPPDEGAEIDDLYGRSATLDCHVEDAAGHRAERSFPVTVTAG